MTISDTAHVSFEACGGPVPATGKSVAANYVYVMGSDDEMIRHMSGLLNDGYSSRALG